MIPWLAGDADFPPLELARSHPNGLLCAGGDLAPERILAAYRRGMELMKYCQAQLADAEQQIRVLENGELKAVDRDSLVAR